MKFELALRGAALIFAVVIVAGHAASPEVADLDLSPEKYRSILESLQIADVFVQTVFKVDPVSASVTVERLEFLPASGDFLISTGTGGASMIQKLQLAETPEELTLSPALAWIGGATFSFHDQSGRWYKMSRPAAPSLSVFRTLSYKALSEVSHLEKQLLIQLEDGSLKARGDRFVADAKKLLGELESDSANPKKFSIGNEGYLVTSLPSGLVERLTIFEDEIVKLAVLNTTAKNLSQPIKELVDASKDSVEILSKAELNLFQKLSEDPLRQSLSPDKKFSVSIEKGTGNELRLLVKNTQTETVINISSQLLIGVLSNPDDPIPEIKWNPSSRFFILGRKTPGGFAGKIISFNEPQTEAIVSNLQVPFALESYIVSYEFTKDDGIRVTQQLANGRVATALISVEPNGSVRGNIEK